MRDRVGERADRFSSFLVGLLPLLFILGRAIADGAVILVAFAFLLRSAAYRDWDWLREPWVQVALAWVAWLTFAGFFAQDISSAVPKAADQIRFVLFTVSVATVHLRRPTVRATFFASLWAAVVLVSVDCVIQVITGTSLSGRSLPEAYRLSGPFGGQRAGTFLGKTIFPALLPLLILSVRRELPGWAPLLPLAAIGAIIALTGERSALLVLGLGTFCCLVLLPRLRTVLVPTLLAFVLGVGALVFSRPILIERFVGHTESDLSDFADKRYGLILRSGLALFAEQPITGIGVAEYPKRCLAPELSSIGPADVRCVTHPHNPWMEMLVEGGVIALGLWLAMLGTWLVRFAKSDRVVFAAGLASLLPFAWPLMTSMSLFVTWNAILWWQAMGLMLALSPLRAETPR